MCVRLETPWHVWAVGNAIFLLSLGTLAFHYANGFHPPLSDFEAINSLKPQPHDHPWFTAVWALALWCSLIGSILVFMKKRLSFPVLALALTASAVSLAFSVSPASLQGVALIYLLFRVTVFAGIAGSVWYARELSDMYVLTE